MIIRMHLLELCSQLMRCDYLSDLHFLGDVKRRELCRKIERIQAHEHDIKEWNDMLEYLTRAAPEPTAELAKVRLIESLLHPRYTS